MTGHWAEVNFTGNWEDIYTTVQCRLPYFYNFDWKINKGLPAGGHCQLALKGNISPVDTDQATILVDVLSRGGKHGIIRIVLQIGIFSSTMKPLDVG